MRFKLNLLLKENPCGFFYYKFFTVSFVYFIPKPLIYKRIKPVVLNDEKKQKLTDNPICSKEFSNPEGIKDDG